MQRNMQLVQSAQIKELIIDNLKENQTKFLFKYVLNKQEPGLVT